jgi:hypothetical protein
MPLPNGNRYKPAAKLQRKPAIKLGFRDAENQLDLELIKRNLAELNK